MYDDLTIVEYFTYSDILELELYTTKIPKFVSLIPPQNLLQKYNRVKQELSDISGKHNFSGAL